MKKLILVAVALVVGLGAIGFTVISLKNEQKSSGTASTAQKPTSPTENKTQSSPEKLKIETTTITYDEKGFTPNSIIVAKGSTVNFVNNRAEFPMWIASAPHPDHTEYPELDTSREFEDHVPPDNPSYSFIFDKPGSWTYHNHSGPEHEGTVIVK